MHHGTCVTHLPWCMSGSLTCGDGENVPIIPGACAPAILRIWQEAPWGLGSLHSQIERLGLKCKNTFISTKFATYSNIHILPGVWCLSPVHCLNNLARNKLKFVCFKLRQTHVFDFKMASEATLPLVVRHNNWVKAHAVDVIIVWRDTHNNTKLNAIWFLVTFTDTDLKI